MAVGAVVARILTQYSDKGSKAAQKDIAKLGKSFDDFAKKSVKAFGVVAVAAGALAVKIGKDSIQAAIKAQAEQNRLTQILLTTKGATLQQIEALNQQADALERVGVVSGGNIKVAQAQLATFDLQASTIQKLTPAILDYVTAEKGATASASDFKSMTNGLAQALQGNFASLTRTGFVLDEATKNLIKNGTESERATALVKVLNSTYKDFNKTLRDTPEGKIIALRNALDKIKVSIGAALLPSLEKFVNIIESRILPQIESWVALNRTKLIKSFELAASAAIRLTTAALAFSSWIVNNMGLVKTMAVLISGLFVASKVAAFAVALGKATAAWKAYQAAAGLAAIATAYATGGVSIGSATAAIALVGGIAAITGGVIALKSAGDKVRKAKVDKALLSDRGLATRAANEAAKNAQVTKTTTTKTVNDEINTQNKLNAAKKKELTIEQKIINAMLKKFKLTLMTSEIEAKATAKAIEENLIRQGKIAKSAPTVSLAAQGDGSASGGSPIMNSGSPQVSVTINTPFGTEDDYTVKIQNDLTTLARRRGGRTGSGINTGIYAE
jgi:hypothetical protein